jgi:ribosomal protein S12 methylthiotransferase
VPRRFWIETLGCPKNQVDSDKLLGTLLADGFEPAATPGRADLVVVNTCAFIDEARQESIDTILSLSDRRKKGAEVVVTGCLAERHGAELAAAIPEVSVRGFDVSVHAPVATGEGVAVTLGRTRRADVPSFDLLNLPRPRSPRPWAYVKIAEGCDRQCGFCAIPSFRGKQRSRSMEAIVDEVVQLGAREIVLVAQDLASYGRDQGVGEKQLVPLIEAVSAKVDRVRLLYLYPSELTDKLIDTIGATGVPYFDLSLQHVSAPLVRRMRRWGNGDKFLARIDAIRGRFPTAAFRSNFIVGYPGETEADHDALLAFVDAAQLDWCGFFAYSAEPGTYATTLDGAVERSLMDERLRELRAAQDDITALRRDALIGQDIQVLVDEPGVGRSHREAPEIDGIVQIPTDLAVGTFATVRVTDALGPDLVAETPSSPSSPLIPFRVMA